MKITSARFVKGLAGTDAILEDGTPQIAFIGRSNVGKSSVINALVGKDLARTSAFPGRTQEINVFLINGTSYLVDLPGYGFARASQRGRERLWKLINWYFFDSPYEQKKIGLIVDASIGFQESDIAMLRALEEKEKDVVIVANKVDKIKKSAYQKQIAALTAAAGGHPVVPCSAKGRIGFSDLARALWE